MTTIAEVNQFLETFAPQRLAEEWDNVGLLVGDATRSVSKIMTCLTVTPDSVCEAVEEDVDLIVSHHPLPFRPLKRLTTDSVAGQMLLDLIRANVAVYSPHTSFDSARSGINQVLADRIGLLDVRPISPFEGDPDGLGSGRVGKLPEAVTLDEFASNVKEQFELIGVHVVGKPDQPVQQVGLACGSGGTFLEPARRIGCDTLLTGETNFHTCLEADAQGIGMVLVGHFASERFALDILAQVIKTKFSELQIWASRKESDPVRWL